MSSMWLSRQNLTKMLHPLSHGLGTGLLSRLSTYVFLNDDNDDDNDDNNMSNDNDDNDDNNNNNDDDDNE